MSRLIMKRALIIVTLILLFATAFSPALDTQIRYATNLDESVEEPIYTEIIAQDNTLEKIEYDKIVDAGFHQLEEWKQTESKLGHSINNQETYKSLLTRLQKWYESHPQVDFASLTDNSMTIKFCDGFYEILMNLIPSSSNTFNTEYGLSFIEPFAGIVSQKQHCSTVRRALVLHPFYWQVIKQVNCPLLASGAFLKFRLRIAGLSVVDYKEDEEVNIDFIKSGLVADVVFNFGHGGYRDLDGDSKKDTVVLCSGEPWTNDTPQKYLFEYNRGWIVKSGIRDGNSTKYFVGYCPGLIKYYYTNSFRDGTLIFMATCDSLKDCDMAKAFVDDAGADAYIGWTGHALSWPNAIVSHTAIRLLSKGWTVEKVCNKIGYGCLLHIILGCRLAYYGDGRLTIRS